MKLQKITQKRWFWPLVCAVSVVFGWWYLSIVTCAPLGGVTVAGGLLLLSLYMDKRMQRETLGGGDIKLMAACGLVLGLPKGLLATVVGLTLLLFYAAAYRITCKVRGREAEKAFPLAPFLSAGCLLAYFI